ncbi:hydroxymethylglutaryl-CoA synthase family protein [Nostoc sp. ChiQUE01b]|uniref:hydroxymethylglutaryl-CoA synthase family protein n=1 Tax=Nostoc sp. ChiQUE01b TaxID=3075376 RepID=UPI002AD541E0|nr:hydroxymethylglutaryl-CoA synthase [Nostoc sp. ChiQUE01b]MDZ8262104.1 hydroxymethylglutaryl-CoA synthase [Nostoc sp. ChiQUE01b]
MPIGIEKLNLYSGQFYLEIADLAEARGKNFQHIADSLMCKTRSVYPVYEDAITLAVNAAKQLLSPQDLEDIELLIVGTESAVDCGKSLSTWVHRFCNLSPNCRNFEVKHACYGGTAAFKMAASWVVSGARPGKKALVINTDFSSVTLNTDQEFICGGGAVAMLVSANPQILEIELDKAGYWTKEISDYLRPTFNTEVIKSETSLYSYLDALEGAFSHYEQIVGSVDYDADFKKHIYHAPFPAMTFQAHRTILNRFEAVGKAAAKLSFQSKVAESIHFAQQIGSSYGGSNFICLLSLLNYAKDLSPGDRISLFAYGGGCQAEFYSATIGKAATEIVRSLNIDEHLNQRLRLSVADYEASELTREKYSDRRDFNLENYLDERYEKRYRDRGLLVLSNVENYYRQYKWS